MTDERFSLRYGYEQKPEHPIFDEAPKRLRFFILKSFQKYFSMESPLIIGETLCRTELITQFIPPTTLWEVLSPYIETCTGWGVYNLIEAMHAELRKKVRHYEANVFEREMNQLFGEESIG